MKLAAVRRGGAMVDIVCSLKKMNSKNTVAVFLVAVLYGESFGTPKDRETDENAKIKKHQNKFEMTSQSQ
jgi:hypothetical protein